MSGEYGGLPRILSDGLVMRWATPDDAKALAKFNVRIHSDDAENPEEGLRVWTLDLMSGDHPTTNAGDFIVVVDERAGRKIVSSLNLISQTWSYETTPFAAGRIELVGTDPDYRRRGLVRAQMDVIHRRSEERGELVQVITGIPWYYRLFGYEMALDLGGSRFYPRERLVQLKAPEEENYHVRSATVDDIPLLSELYARHCATSMVNRLRDGEQWRYELSGPHVKSFYHRRFRIVEDVESGEPLGYFEWQEWPVGIAIRELAVAPGRSLRALALRISRHVADLVDEKVEERAKTKNPSAVIFALGPAHPAYDALPELAEGQLPYAWYVRVADLSAFLKLIKPVLESRLASSVMAGHSGQLRLNLFTERIRLHIAEGRLAEIGSYEGKRLEEGDASFPGLSFLQLLFGHRSLAELRHAYPDCSASREATVLLTALFPRKVSQPVGLG